MYIQSLIIFACINMIAVSGLALLTGYTGIFSIGHAGFLAIGAYASVIAYMDFGVPYFLAILLGGLASVVVSVIIGYPALRNKMAGDAFAIVMLGFCTVVRVIISNTQPFFNGALGISGIPKLSTVWIIIAFTVVMVACMRNYIHSDFGKNCLAVQQQELAAEMVGISLLKTKLISLMISAFYGGVSGGLYAFFATFLSPSTFADAKSDDLVAAVVLGGMCSLSGPLAAAAILIILPEVLRFLEIWRLVFYGIAFVIIMQFKPEGLFGYQEFSFRWIKVLYHKMRRKSNGSSVGTSKH